MKVCYAEQMRHIDKLASEKFGIPSILLMENAAVVCADKIKHFNSFTIICGKGNNGGDGLAIARRLINMGKSVNVFLAFGDDFGGDAAVYCDILKKGGVKLLNAESGGSLKYCLENSECCIDAIFGTGMNRVITAPLSEVIEEINSHAKYVVAIDVPSGINSDTGEICGCCVKANETITLAAYKTGLLMYPGADIAGKITVGDILIPDAAYEYIDSSLDTLDEDYINSIMPKRHENSQKGDYGKVLAIGGSVGMAGAVCLAAEACFKVGAGMVTACVPNEINDIIQIKSTPTMTFPVDFGADIDRICAKLNDYDVILFGNGIGRNNFVGVLLETVLEKANVPVVIDADGLFALAKNPKMLTACKTEVIITPHSMEMARLLGIDVSEVEKNRLSVSKEFVSAHKLTLVLKGNHSIITAPDGHQFINMTGNSGMATAGSGDVLAGMTAGLLARKVSAENAARLAVYLHGKAGDYAKEKLSADGMNAVDILNAVPHILPVENKIKV